MAIPSNLLIELSKHLGRDEVIVLGTLEDDPSATDSRVWFSDSRDVDVPRHRIIAHGRKS